MACCLGERPLGATGTGERAQRGLAEGRWGVRADAGSPRGRGFAPDWRLSGKGRGRLPSGVLTNPVCPAGRRQRGCSCGRCAGAEEAWSSLWLGRCPRAVHVHVSRESVELRGPGPLPAVGAARSSAGTMSEDGGPPVPRGLSG